MLFVQPAKPLSRVHVVLQCVVHDEEQVSTVLGFIAHLVLMLSKYLQVPCERLSPFPWLPPGPFHFPTLLVVCSGSTALSDFVLGVEIGIPLLSRAALASS